MRDKPELKRKLLNACAAVTSFVVVLVLSYLYTLLEAVIYPDRFPYGVTVALWVLALGAGIALMFGAYRPRPAAESEFAAEEAVPPPRRGKPIYLVPATVFALLAVNIVFSLCGIAKTDAPTYKAGEFALRAVLGCTVIPVLEESFFRGALLSGLREREDPLALRIGAALLTGAAFAVFHPENGFRFALAAGVILAVPAPFPEGGKRRFLPPFAPIAAHALYNLALYLSLALMMTGLDPVTTLSIFAGAAAVTAGIMILTGGKSDAKRRKNKENNG